MTIPQNMNTFGVPISNPLDAVNDKDVDDKLLDDASIDVYPEGSEEEPEACNQFFDLIFRSKCSS